MSQTPEQKQDELARRKAARDSRTREQINRKKEIDKRSYLRRKENGRLKHPVPRSVLPLERQKHKREVDNLWVMENQDKVKEKAKRYSRSTKGRFKFMRNTALKRDLEVSISIEEYGVLIALPCSYCNGEMNCPSVMGIGLDRIDNDKGYHIDNVLPCCTACNAIRSQFLSVEETKIAIRAVLDYRKQILASPAVYPKTL